MLSRVIYTNVSVEDVQEVLSQIGAGRVTTVSPLSGGYANSNFRVDRCDGPPLVLKIWNNRSVEAADLIARHMLYLAVHGVPTPAPFQASDGSLVSVVEGCAWMFQPFIDGHWLKPTPQSMGNIGELLACLHGVPVPDGLPSQFQMGLGLMDRVLVDGADLDHPFVSRLAAEVAEIRAKIPPNLPKGVIHGDLFADNVIAQGDSIQAILDFEEIACDAFVLDIGMAFVGCGWEGGRPVRARWDALLKGYERIRPLSVIERDALPVFLRYATLGIATWRFDQFVLRKPELGMGDRYREMTDRMDGKPGLY